MCACECSTRDTKSFAFKKKPWKKFFFLNQNNNYFYRQRCPGDFARGKPKKKKNSLGAWTVRLRRTTRASPRRARTVIFGRDSEGSLRCTVRLLPFYLFSTFAPNIFSCRRMTRFHRRRYCCCCRRRFPRKKKKKINNNQFSRVQRSRPIHVQSPTVIVRAIGILRSWLKIYTCACTAEVPLLGRRLTVRLLFFFFSPSFSKRK